MVRSSRAEFRGQVIGAGFLIVRSSWLGYKDALMGNGSWAGQVDCGYEKCMWSAVNVQKCWSVWTKLQKC